MTFSVDNKMIHEDKRSITTIDFYNYVLASFFVVSFASCVSLTKLWQKSPCLASFPNLLILS